MVLKSLEGVNPTGEEGIERKNNLLALAPRSSLSSLSTAFVWVDAVVVAARASLVPRPQGSERFTDKPVALFSVVFAFADQGFAVVLDEDVPVCHGSSVVLLVIAEFRPSVSGNHGSSIDDRRKRSEQEEEWAE